jgi:hypothetical protein
MLLLAVLPFWFMAWITFHILAGVFGMDIHFNR